MTNDWWPCRCFNLREVEDVSKEPLRSPLIWWLWAGGLSSRACVCVCVVAKSCPTVACQAPLSVGFSRQEYWSGFLFPSPGPPPDPGMEIVSPCIAGRFFTIWATREALLSRKEKGKELNVVCDHDQLRVRFLSSNGLYLQALLDFAHTTELTHIILISLSITRCFKNGFKLFSHFSLVSSTQHIEVN